MRGAPERRSSAAPSAGGWNDRLQPTGTPQPTTRDTQEDRMALRLFDRIGLLLKADAHGVVESLEERSLLLKQYVREAEIELNQKARPAGSGARGREAAARGARPLRGRDARARRGRRAGARRRQGRSGALRHPPPAAAAQRSRGAARADRAAQRRSARRSPSASPRSRRSSTACACACAPSWHARATPSAPSLAGRRRCRRRRGRARAHAPPAERAR